MQNVKNIFVIGNGFDLSLGLPTAYPDFLNSDFFKKNLESCELFNQINEKANLEKWIDVEAELAKISKKNENNPNFLRDYKLLCNCLSEYIDSQPIESINRESPAYNLLKTHYSPSNSFIANFNYTNTVQFILNELSVPLNAIDASVCHVHGQSSKKNLIFGVDDNARIHEDHTFLYKSTLNSDGGRDVKHALENTNRVFFFGHSLGESDNMYFEQFFMLNCMYNKQVELHFYYYSETGLFELHKQLHRLTGSQVCKLKGNNIFYVHDTSAIA